MMWHFARTEPKNRAGRLRSVAVGLSWDLLHTQPLSPTEETDVWSVMHSIHNRLRRYGLHTPTLAAAVPGHELGVLLGRVVQEGGFGASDRKRHTTRGHTLHTNISPHRRSRAGMPPTPNMLLDTTRRPHAMCWWAESCLVYPSPPAPSPPCHRAPASIWEAAAAARTGMYSTWIGTSVVKQRPNLVKTLTCCYPQSKQTPVWHIYNTSNTKPYTTPRHPIRHSKSKARTARRRATHIAAKTKGGPRLAGQVYGSYQHNVNKLKTSHTTSKKSPSEPPQQ
jgi:hypothetical protein